MSKCREWRKGLEAQFELGAKVEAFAIVKGLTDFGVISEFQGSLQIFMQRQELQVFAQKVKETEEIMRRPPDTVRTGGANGGQAPDLVARWDAEPDGYAVTIINWWPEGCKIDPRTEYVEPEYPDLHPECQSVLKELEG